MRGQALTDDGEQAIALDTVAAIAEQDFPDAMFGEMLADQLLLAGTKFDFCRIEKSEVVHFDVLADGLVLLMDCTLVFR